jgi:hypothetical protein
MENILYTRNKYDAKGNGQYLLKGNNLNNSKDCCSRQHNRYTELHKTYPER